MYIALRESFIGDASAMYFDEKVLSGFFNRHSQYHFLSCIMG
jgi:hypothetical protein